MAAKNDPGLLDRSFFLKMKRNWQKLKVKKFRDMLSRWNLENLAKSGRGVGFHPPLWLIGLSLMIHSNTVTYQTHPR